ncbi:hypothetical protein BHAP_0250 [Bifidobacterium hapali]|uniref:Dihydrouridine synthase n=1 Tax=Bifidobacterium hapali TaxID=1630172 RepID=A0A261G4Q7_9BIFI|nr:DivIVA domain-containing protein [Bifidobacterium hapali]OZG66388.1 hypothetical protein BHAP_0250 [Bifidobacterium hapali]
MAQEAEAERGGSSIARAGKRKLGYDTGQVDAFLNRAHALYDGDAASLTQQDIQNVSFDLAKDGYDIAQVDAALSRLERAVVDRQTSAQISDQGRVAWRAQTEELYRQIAHHAERAERERFADGRKGQPSYDRKQVDRLIDDVVDKATADLDLSGASHNNTDSLANITSVTVSNAVFTQRKGARGYDERQVDYFLNACVQLLSRLESFARVSDLVQNDQDSETQFAPQQESNTPQGAVAPLFPAATATATAAQDAGAIMPASDNASSDSSFDALHKAEQAIFAAPAASAAVSAQASVATATESNVVDTPAAPQPPSFAPHDHDQSAASQPAEPTQPAVNDYFAGQGDSSLAQLAHMAEESQERTDAPSIFRPHMPALTTPMVPDASTVLASAATSSAETEATDKTTADKVEPSVAPQQNVTSHESANTASANVTDMPVSFAPAVKPAHTTPRGRVSQSVAQPVAVVSTPSQPVAPQQSVSQPVQPVVPVQPVQETAQPLQPIVVQPAVVQPAVSSTQQTVPQTAQQNSANDAHDKDDSGVFPSLFPQIDTDIPDLSFPSLYGDDDDKK